MAEDEIDDPGTFLKQAEKDAIAAEIKKRGAPRPCEMCGTDNWIVGNYLVSPTQVLRAEGGVTYLLTGRLHTSAVLLCSNCGNTKLFNVGILGLSRIIENPET